MEANREMHAWWPAVQPFLVGLGAVFSACSLIVQAWLLLVSGPATRQEYTGTSTSLPGFLAFFTTWRWPLFIVALAAQVVCILLAARHRRRAVWLLLSGAAWSAATSVVVLLFVLLAVAPLYGHLLSFGK